MRGIRRNRWLAGPTGRVGADSVPVGTQNMGLNGKIGTDRHSRLDRQSQVFGMTEKFFDRRERKNRKFGIFAKASF